ncbi:hypothetical protein ELQ90_02950 [Labedella phragmitis]|uniref:BMP family ABC transporter substrate-binding protein n=1 Tax=Labedella phragmitis TaxID=2498849 RepID=A0A444PYE2_9MICO|nr:hypothetical protein [Labedella phragmitis]RWZ52912.1 hypothetical protein ELQ90_02950 [Labedella phragmitis]
MPTSPRPLRRAGALAAAAALAVTLVGCVAGGSTPSGDEAGVVPAPGRTIEAAPSAIAELRGYRIAVVVPDDSEASETLLTAARAFADDSGAELVEFAAAVEGDDPIGNALAAALDADADVVVGLGEGVVGVFDFETGKVLHQEVLVIGGQLAEPTENVTAVIWPGATAREPTDDESMTVERGLDAFTVGVTSVRAGVTGVVLSLD